MKVTLCKEYRRLYTLDELDRAKQVILSEKEDEMSPKDWAEYAAREAMTNDDFLIRVIEASAETALNNRVWDQYGDDTQHMDVWISFIAKTYLGFIEGGACLSDIWQAGVVPFKQHMYINYFRRVE